MRRARGQRPQRRDWKAHDRRFGKQPRKAFHGRGLRFAALNVDEHGQVMPNRAQRRAQPRLPLRVGGRYTQ